MCTGTSFSYFLRFISCGRKGLVKQTSTQTPTDKSSRPKDVCQMEGDCVTAIPKLTSDSFYWWMSCTNCENARPLNLELLNEKGAGSFEEQISKLIEAKVLETSQEISAILEDAKKKVAAAEPEKKDDGEENEVGEREHDSEADALLLQEEEAPENDQNKSKESKSEEEKEKDETTEQHPHSDPDHHHHHQ